MFFKLKTKKNEEKFGDKGKGCIFATSKRNEAFKKKILFFFGGKRRISVGVQHVALSRLRPGFESRIRY